MVACYPTYDFEDGNLPDTPVNLEEFNSVYDDYNASAPTLGRLILFCFSTNRNSKGNSFDVIYQPMNVNFDKTTGILKETSEYSGWSIFMDEYEVIKKGLQKINTPGNEFGPNLIIGYSSDEYNYTLLYASDETGNFQIHFTSNKTIPGFSESNPVSFLNSEYDDLYPSFNKERTKLYFCSNRENENYDIYFSDIDNSEDDLELLLSDTSSHNIYRDTMISSDYDDKCPYIFDNTLVFTSNRQGGFGGYDLYTSMFENGEWSAPENLGPEINSEYDEYRPILFNEEVDNEKYMMVFSSNRIVGKGGFDLYYVGIKIQ